MATAPFVESRDMAIMAEGAILSTRRRSQLAVACRFLPQVSQERAMSKFKDLGQYVEVAIIGVLAIAALAGIIRFIILADVF
jgi:hypothetical protein